MKVTRRDDLGTDVAVNPVTGQLAYNVRDANGVSQLYVDGVMLKQSLGALGNRHKHKAMWSPDGTLLMFTSVSPDYEAPWWLADQQAQVQAINGWCSDLYILDWATKRYNKVTSETTVYNLRRRKPCGVFHARFNADGSKVLYGALSAFPAGSKFGVWSLRLGHVERDTFGTVVLIGVREVKVSDDALMQEPHGWTPDGKLLVCSHYDHPDDELRLDLYEIDVDTCERANITNTPDEWDEHARFSPSGDIVWMCSSPYSWDTADQSTVKTEVVRRRLGSSDVEVLTGFNRRGSGHYNRQKSLAYPTGFSPDGTLLYVTQVMTGVDYPERRSWVVELD